MPAKAPANLGSVSDFSKYFNGLGLHFAEMAVQNLVAIGMGKLHVGHRIQVCLGGFIELGEAFG